MLAGDTELLRFAGFMGPDSTNNKAEMMAAMVPLLAVAVARPDARVKVLTDSQYLTLGMNGRLDKWKRNGWKTADKKPVKNQVFWEALDAINTTLAAVEWVWIKGHSGDRYNEEVDGMANAAIELGMANA